MVSHVKYFEFLSIAQTHRTWKLVCGKMILFIGRKLEKVLVNGIYMILPRWNTTLWKKSVDVMNNLTILCDGFWIIEIASDADIHKRFPSVCMCICVRAKSMYLLCKFFLYFATLIEWIMNEFANCNRHYKRIAKFSIAPHAIETYH